MRLKDGKKRTESSKRWLLRHLSDPYVKQSKKDGYKSRAAYKILEIQEKFHIIKPHQCIVDLGAAPGGWSQVCSQILKNQGQIVAIDLLDMDPIEHVIFLKDDFTTSTYKLKDLCPNGIDVILSDMAPSTCGVAKVDHLRIMGLLEEILLFAEENLNKGGHLVAKVFQGGAEQTVLKQLKAMFEKVVHFKPKSSRAESSEMYLVAISLKK